MVSELFICLNFEKWMTFRTVKCFGKFWKVFNIFSIFFLLSMCMWNFPLSRFVDPEFKILFFVKFVVSPSNQPISRPCECQMNDRLVVSNPTITKIYDVFLSCVCLFAIFSHQYPFYMFCHQCYYSSVIFFCVYYYF